MVYDYNEKEGKNKMKITSFFTAKAIVIAIAFAILALAKNEYAIAACLFATAGMAIPAWGAVENSEKRK